MNINNLYKTALIAVLFLSSEPSYASPYSSLQCNLSNKSVILVLSNKIPSSFTVHTNNNSTFQQKSNLGKTKIIMHKNQLPLTIEFKNDNYIWTIESDCTINKKST